MDLEMARKAGIRSEGFVIWRLVSFWTCACYTFNRPSLLEPGSFKGEKPLWISFL